MFQEFFSFNTDKANNQLAGASGRSEQLIELRISLIY